MMTSPSRPFPPAPLPARRIIPEALVPERSGATVWLSNLERSGEWTLPRIYRLFTFMGNIELDLTTARVGAGTSEIEISCILGNIEITVSREIRVECDWDGFAGNFSVVRVGDTTPPDDAPLLRVTGNVYFGNVEVKIIGPKGPGLKDKLLTAWRDLNS
jgi:hypothetical protein